MKKVVRLCWGLLIGSYALLSLLTDYFARENAATGFFVILMGVLGGFTLLGCLFYHWYRTPFKVKGWKVFWFLTLIYGLYYMIGPIMYYLMVFEFGKTVKIRNNSSSVKLP